MRRHRTMVWIGNHAHRLAVALILSAGLNSPRSSMAQTSPAVAKTEVAAPTAKDSGSLARFIPGNRLIFFDENAGLKNHAEPWQKTNAYKMLTSTPLGAMLEAVAAQFLDQIFATDPTRKVSGAEVVSLIKHVVLNGWAVAINTTDSGPRPYRITLVFRGATGKSMRGVTSRMLGAAMGDIRPRIVRKEGRTIIAVDIPAPASPAPAAATPAATGAAKAASAVAPPLPVTWIWWAEQEDLVIGIFPGDDGALLLSTVDGKTPSAVGHANVVESRKATGSLRPISTRFLDLSNLGGNSGHDWLLTALGRIKDLTGSTRVEQTMGVDEETLVSTTKLGSSKPFKSFSSLFEVAPFKRSKLIPIPEGVNSFAAFSIRAERLPGLAEYLDPTGGLKTTIDAFSQSLKASSRIDLETDLLARLGPRMTFYLSPVRSAAAEDEPFSLQSVFAGGINFASMMTAAKPFIPEATFVAEVREPVAFGKALDGFIIALNKEIKARATEMEEEETDATSANDAGGRGRNGEGPGTSTSRRAAPRTNGDRSTTRRGEVLTPKFNPIASPTNIRKFQLSTPSASKYRLGPPHFRPMIYMDGQHLVISASADTAKVAIEALARNSWRPSQEADKALAKVPSQVVALVVIDPGQTTPTILSSFPGTVQTQINTGIALANAQAAALPAAGAPAASTAPATPTRPRNGPGAEPFRSANDPEFGERRGGRRGMEGLGAGGGFPQPAAAKSAATPQMVQLHVEPDQLPKAEDLKALLFPTTVSIVEDQDGILITQRSAFPEQIGLQSNAMVIGFMMPLIQAARAQTRTASAPAATPAAPNGQPGSGPAGQRGGRRGRDDR